MIDREGEPWFVAKDVCAALDMPGYASSHVNHLGAEERQSISRGSVTRDDSHLFDSKAPSVTLVSESGLYSLILKSRKPEASAFKKWVTAEVLPTIRKTGGYMAPSVANMAETDPEQFLANKTCSIGEPQHLWILLVHRGQSIKGPHMEEPQPGK